MTPGLKRLLITAACFLAIGLAVFSIIRRYRAPAYNVELHQYIGRVMAEQTARIAGPKGNITYITIPTGGEPELETQLAAFKQTLRKLGAYALDEEELDPKNQPKYGLGNGLSGRRFVRTVNKNLDADAVVSFIGAPEISDEELRELKKQPRFIAEARSPDDLPKLFEKKILQVAVVSRFVFPAPGPLKPTTTEEWFHKRYQVITPELAAQCFQTD
jgi:hypothetical protein